jgi:hypothetical protein
LSTCAAIRWTPLPETPLSDAIYPRDLHHSPL